MAKVESTAVLEKVKTGEVLTPDEKQAVMIGDITESGVTTIEAEGKKPEEKKTEPKEKVKTGGSDKPDKKPSEDSELKEGAGDKPSDKESTPPKDDKKTGEETVEGKPKTEDWGEKSERELRKPEGEEDLTTFSPREKGLFYELRQQRRRAQRAEVEAREAEYKLFQERNTQKENAKKSTPEEVTKIFDGREDDDLLTVGEAKKVLEAARKAPGPGIDESMKKQIVGMQFQLNLMKTQQKYPDAPQVIALLDTLLDNDDPYSKMAQEEVSAAFTKGGNFVQVAYNFIKGHPKFSEYEGRIIASNGSKADSSEAKDPDAEEKKERAKKLAENQNKSKTTGGEGGGDIRRAGEYTEQELREMTPEQWRKLPANIRKKLLQG